MKSRRREVLHRALVKSLSLTGRLEHATRTLAASGTPIVLTLHRVVPDAELDVCRSPRGMVLRESSFCKLLTYLCARADMLSPVDLAITPSARPRVMLTFDDGWADNAEVALPHLAAAGVHAHFFIATDMVGQANPFWPERVQALLNQARYRGLNAELHRSAQTLESPKSGETPRTDEPASDEALLTWLKQFSPADLLQWIDTTEAALSASRSPHDKGQGQDLRERMMTWEQLRCLVDAGHSLGSHTCTHALLSGLSPEQRLDELLRSKRTLEQQLCLKPHETPSISYPNGWASPEVAEAAHEAGYGTGFTTTIGVCRAISDPMLLPRINVWDGTVTRPDGTFCEDHLKYALFWKPLHARSRATADRKPQGENRRRFAGDRCPNPS